MKRTFSQYKTGYYDFPVDEDNKTLDRADLEIKNSVNEFEKNALIDYYEDIIGKQAQLRLGTKSDFNLSKYEGEYDINLIGNIKNAGLKKINEISEYLSDLIVIIKNDLRKKWERVIDVPTDREVLERLNQTFDESNEKMMNILNTNKDFLLFNISTSELNEDTSFKSQFEAYIKNFETIFIQSFIINYEVLELKIASVTLERYLASSFNSIDVASIRGIDLKRKFLQDQLRMKAEHQRITFAQIVLLVGFFTEKYVKNDNFDRFSSLQKLYQIENKNTNIKKSIIDTLNLKEDANTNEEVRKLLDVWIANNLEKNKLMQKDDMLIQSRLSQEEILSFRSDVEIVDVMVEERIEHYSRAYLLNADKIRMKQFYNKLKSKYLVLLKESQSFAASRELNKRNDIRKFEIKKFSEYFQDLTLKKSINELGDFMGTIDVLLTEDSMKLMILTQQMENNNKLEDYIKQEKNIELASSFLDIDKKLSEFIKSDTTLRIFEMVQITIQSIISLKKYKEYYKGVYSEGLKQEDSLFDRLLKIELMRSFNEQQKKVCLLIAFSIDKNQMKKVELNLLELMKAWKIEYNRLTINKDKDYKTRVTQKDESLKADFQKFNNFISLGKELVKNRKIVKNDIDMTHLHLTVMSCSFLVPQLSLFFSIDWQRFETVIAFTQALLFTYQDMRTEKITKEGAIFALQPKVRVNESIRGLIGFMTTIRSDKSIPEPSDIHLGLMKMFFGLEQHLIEEFTGKLTSGIKISLIDVLMLDIGFWNVKKFDNTSEDDQNVKIGWKTQERYYIDESVVINRIEALNYTMVLVFLYEICGKIIEFLDKNQYSKQVSYYFLSYSELYNFTVMLGSVEKTAKGAISLLKQMKLVIIESFSSLLMGTHEGEKIEVKIFKIKKSLKNTGETTEEEDEQTLAKFFRDMYNAASTANYDLILQAVKGFVDRNTVYIDGKNFQATNKLLKVSNTNKDIRVMSGGILPILDTGEMTHSIIKANTGFTGYNLRQSKENRQNIVINNNVNIIGEPRKQDFSQYKGIEKFNISDPTSVGTTIMEYVLPALSSKMVKTGLGGLFFLYGVYNQYQQVATALRGVTTLLKNLYVGISPNQDIIKPAPDPEKKQENIEEEKGVQEVQEKRTEEIMEVKPNDIFQELIGPQPMTLKPKETFPIEPTTYPMTTNTYGQEKNLQQSEYEKLRNNAKNYSPFLMSKPITLTDEYKRYEDRFGALIEYDRLQKNQTNTSKIYQDEFDEEEYDKNNAVSRNFVGLMGGIQGIMNKTARGMGIGEVDASAINEQPRPDQNINISGRRIYYGQGEGQNRSGFLPS